MVRVIGDVHLGNHTAGAGPINERNGLNDRAETVLGCLVDAIYSSPNNKVVQLGDMFDSPEPGAAVLASARRAVQHNHVDFLVGNHDSSRQGSLGALQIFSGSRPRYRVFTQPELVHRNFKPWLMVPFQRAKARNYIGEALKTLAPKDPFLLAIHAGIRDAESADFLKDANDAIDIADLWDFANNYKIAGIFAGNWHNHRFWAGQDQGLCPVVQLGAICPTGWDNPGTSYGYVADVYLQHEDPRAWVNVNKVVTPVFESADYDGMGWLNKYMSFYKFGSHTSLVYLRVKCAPQQRQEAEDELSWCRQNMNMDRWRVHVRATSVKKPQVFVPQRTVSLADSVKSFASSPEVESLVNDYLTKVGS